MKQKPLSELSQEELSKQKSTFTGIAFAFACIWAILLALTIYLFVIKKPSYALMAVMPALLLTMLPLLTSLSKVNTEIKVRRSNIR